MNINVKRYIGAAVAVFLFFFIYEWLVHGHLLQGRYMETPRVWRTMEEMREMMPLHIILLLALAAWVTFVFARVYPEGGIERGLRFGLYFGVFAAILMASWYIWLPVSAFLGWSWFFSSLIESLGAGLILGAIYRRHD